MIKRRLVVVGARRVRSEKLREYQYISLLRGRESSGMDNNAEHMWEQVKWAIVESQCR